MTTTTLSAPSKAEMIKERFSTPLPREKMKKIDRKEFILHYSPQTNIVDKILKAKLGERLTLEINPDMALDVLTLNDVNQNRTIKEKRIRLYSQEMKSKNWKYTGDPIRISKSGKLIDGQHRLWAIYESGTTQRLDFVVGLDDDAFSYIDIGANRTAADVLAIAGFKGSQNQLGYAVKNILSFQNYSKLGSSISGQTITNQMVNKFTRNKTNMQNLVNFMGKAKAEWDANCNFFTIPQWAVIAYILYNLNWSSESAQKRSMRFINELVEGADLKKENPIYKLRKKLENFEEQVIVKNRRKIGNNIFAAKVKFLFNAWDKWIKNELGGELDPDLERMEIPKPRAI